MIFDIFIQLWSAFLFVCPCGLQDIAAKVMSFSQQGPRTVCILSANGAICNVTLRQPAMSGGTVTYEVLWYFYNKYVGMDIGTWMWFYMYLLQYYRTRNVFDEDSG